MLPKQKVQMQKITDNDRPPYTSPCVFSSDVYGAILLPLFSDTLLLPETATFVKACSMYSRSLVFRHTLLAGDNTLSLGEHDLCLLQYPFLTGTDALSGISLSFRIHHYRDRQQAIPSRTLPYSFFHYGNYGTMAGTCPAGSENNYRSTSRKQASPRSALVDCGLFLHVYLLRL